MKIAGWECVTNSYGSRGASHPDRGTITWLQGRVIGSCDAPAEVVMWLIRPALRIAWNAGAFAESPSRPLPTNPYDGEPPNKDGEPS